MTTALATRPAPLALTPAAVAALAPAERAALLALLLSLQDTTPPPPYDDVLPVGCPRGHEHRVFRIVGSND
jgi:hypothetical protein